MAEPLSLTFRSASTNAVVEMDALWDPKANTYFVLWKQIESCFHNPWYVRLGLKQIYFMLDDDFNEILPQRIPCQSGQVFEVVERTESTSSPVSSLAISEHSLNGLSSSLPSGRTSSTTIASPDSAMQGTETAVGRLVRLASTKQPVSDKTMVSTLSTAARTSLCSSGNLYESFLELTKHGNLDQADSIKSEFRQHFAILQNEMGENRDLQEEMKQMLTKMLDLQRETQERLISIQKGIHAILTQTYELLEYPIPRLFIVLPRVSSRMDILSPFTDKFRLYFLCECGEHTRTPSTKISHHIHMAKHDGYDLDRPTEFFEKYGSYILGMLRMLKLGVSVAGYIVPPLAHLKLVEGLDDIQKGLDAVGSTVEAHFDAAIDHLEKLQRDKSITPKGYDQVDQAQALEGAELRQVATFLKGRDEAMVLGSLYRITTAEGHVKWVCFDHYRETYNEKALVAFAENVKFNNGEYDESTGAVKIALKSSSSAREFYGLLVKARNIQEMDISLNWNMTYGDLKQLRDALQIVNVAKLSVDCGNSTGPATDALNRSKRNDPLVHIMMNTRLLSVHLSNIHGFFARSSVFPKKPTPLREIHIHSVFGPKSHGKNLEILLEQSPCLTKLTLVTLSEEMCEALEMVRKNTMCHQQFRNLTISSPLFTVEIDADTLQSSLAKSIDSTSGSDFRAKILKLYGTRLQCLCVDDGFTDQHAELLLDAVLCQDSRLKRLDIILSKAVIKDSQLTEKGLSTLSTMVNIALPDSCWFHFECVYSTDYYVDRMPCIVYRANSCKFYFDEEKVAKGLAIAAERYKSSALYRREFTDDPGRTFSLQHLELNSYDLNWSQESTKGLIQVIVQSPNLTRFEIWLGKMEVGVWSLVVDALDFSTLKELDVLIYDMSVQAGMANYRALVDGIIADVPNSGAVALESMILRDNWGTSTLETQTYIKEEMAKVPTCEVRFLSRGIFLMP